VSRLIVVILIRSLFGNPPFFQKSDKKMTGKKKFLLKMKSYEITKKVEDKNGSFLGENIIDWRVKTVPRMTFFRVRHFSAWQTATIVMSDTHRGPIWKFLCPTCDSSAFQLAVSINGKATCHHCDYEILVANKINQNAAVKAAKTAIANANWAFLRNMIGKLGTMALRARQALELTGLWEPLYTPDMSWTRSTFRLSLSDGREYDGPRGIIYTNGEIQCIEKYPRGIKRGFSRVGQEEEVVWPTSDDIYGQETDDWPVVFGYEEL
tara:strand:+ start:288 stop:1082 length:795 start_codon:yes stop_codon:yes gene_type:complete